MLQLSEVRKINEEYRTEGLPVLPSQAVDKAIRKARQIRKKYPVESRNDYYLLLDWLILVKKGNPLK